MLHETWSQKRKSGGQKEREGEGEKKRWKEGNELNEKKKKSIKYALNLSQVGPTKDPF